MFEIAWEPPDPSGHSRRHREASTIHGWVTKLRGTLTGNERVRSRGIREMRDARAIRAHKKRMDISEGSRGFLYWFSFLPASRKHAAQRPRMVVHRSHRRGSSSGQRSHASRSRSSQHSKKSQPGQGSRLRRAQHSQRSGGSGSTGKASGSSGQRDRRK